MRQSIFTTAATARATRDTHPGRARAGLRGVATLTAAALLSVTAGGSAVADDIYNTIEGTTAQAALDAGAESMSLEPTDTSRTTTLRLQQRNSGTTATWSDTWNGCNATLATPARFTVRSSNPAVATVTVLPNDKLPAPLSPSEVVFTACSPADGTNPQDRTIRIDRVAAGTATISVVVAPTNTAPGTFELAPATFTVTMKAPPPAPPVVEVLGVVDKSSHVKGSPPARPAARRTRTRSASSTSRPSSPRRRPSRTASGPGT